MLSEAITSAQHNNPDSLLALIEKFKPLLKKYAYKLRYEDAYYNLQLDFIQIVLSINLDAQNQKSEGNVMLVNELNNLYPQKVEFYRNDTGEKIYESKAIAVGSKIEHAALDVELPAGEYECTAYFSNLDPDSGATLGVAGAIIHITIQN